MTTGPFSTEAEATAASLYMRTLTEWGRDKTGSIARRNLSDLTITCEHAGVRVGDYDWRTIEWLAQYEPARVAVVAGLISRATAAERERCGLCTSCAARYVRDSGTVEHEDNCPWLAKARHQQDCRISADGFCVHPAHEETQP